MTVKLSKISKNSTRFITKLRQLQATNPEGYIERILGAGIDQLPGSVEFNIARALGTSFMQVREWMSTSEAFRAAVEMIKTSKTAELFAKMENGEITTTAADRLIYANCGQGFEPPKQSMSQSVSANLDVSQLPNGALQKLLDITPADSEQSEVKLVKGDNKSPELSDQSVSSEQQEERASA